MPTIGVDLMGSSCSPQVLGRAASELIEEWKGEVQCVLFALPRSLEGLHLSKAIQTREVKEVIAMDEEPLSAIRKKRQSSTVLGIEALKNRELDAFISCGNTGALMASARTGLNGFGRPALLALLPTMTKEMAVLDVGANSTFKVEHLIEFAHMGIAYQKSRGIEHPTVGLLNIGEEATKGTPEHREAYQRLQALNKDSPIDHPCFVGNVEGREVFERTIDVLVTDGFTGNVFLKTAEGIAAFLLEQIGRMMKELLPLHLKTELLALQRRLDYSSYPGALLCGVDGLVIKCHGDSTPDGLKSSMKTALRLVKHRFIEKIKTELARSV